MAEKILRGVAQIVVYGLFAAFIGYFSAAPLYRHLGPDQGLLRLSVRHAGHIVADCRKRSAEELAKLSPQLRVAQDCPRERSPVHVRVELDGTVLYDESFAPAGLRRDGTSSGYRRQAIPAGDHLLRVQVNDDVRVDGFTYDSHRELKVRPGDIVLIDLGENLQGASIK